ncbi:MAG: CocE/NonD family hydrolase [Paracoccaceae bacterium]
MGFTTEETLWIAMPDGTRLAATLWRPDGDGPFPTVLEFLPYRRRDGTAIRDDSTYPHFAEAGVAGLRVDSRGNGDSEGLFDDEYSPQELQDCVDTIAWIAQQDWSNGAVGMMGISWGGFNGLQVAALRPPALKAVISIASTADRYNDDIHYKGGCLLSANVYWAGTMLSYASRPPDPEVVGNRWAELWRRRLQNMPMLLETWLKHQRRDAYWKHGSICEDWGAIQCPVWVIAGWADGYRNCPATLAQNLEAPVKAMTGPWIHKYPHFAWPKPRADFIGMATDWWHHWLSGEDRGITDWPDYAAYRVEGARPALVRDHDPGQWINVAKDANTVNLKLGDAGRLDATHCCKKIFSSPLALGTTSGEYFTVVPDAELPADQRTDDALSACWDLDPLEHPMNVVGRPTLVAQVSSDQTQGHLIARLCDVHPDGTSTLIARGMLNLCHRKGNEMPKAMTPGQAEAITLRLDETTYRLPKGHKLRLALSTSYWPMIIPPPAKVTLTLSEAELVLPTRPDAPEIDIATPADPDPLPDYPKITPSSRKRSVEQDLTQGSTRYAIHEDTGLTEHPRNGIQFRDTRDEAWEVQQDDPNSVTGTLTFISERRRGAWATKTEARVSFRARESSFDVTASLEAWDGEEPFERRDWAFSIPRDHM